MASRRPGARTREGTAPITIASLPMIGIAEEPRVHGLLAANLRETDDEKASCAGSRRSDGATRCPQ
jgi:hypothetical protein